MKLFGYTIYGSEEPEIEITEPIPQKKEENSGGQMIMLKNVVIGGGLGMASGYSYHKYRQMMSVGFGMGFLGTQMKKRIWKYLDFNGDGKVDFDDVEAVEDKLHFQITMVGVGAFVCGFGGGYLVGFW